MNGNKLGSEKSSQMFHNVKLNKQKLANLIDHNSTEDQAFTALFLYLFILFSHNSANASIVKYNN